MIEYNGVQDKILFFAIQLHFKFSSQNATIEACVNALGQAVPSMALPKGLWLKESYKNNIPAGPVKGSMTRDLFVQWIYISKLKFQGNIPLILDGAVCHRYFGE